MQTTDGGYRLENSQLTVDFDDAWQWVGYARKDNALTALKKDFEEGADFNLLNKKEVRIEGCRKVKRSFTAIFLTADCFKAFCMMAGTEKGKEVRRYFLDVEKRRLDRGAWSEVYFPHE